MYKHGQFASTPIGRMRVGIPENWIDVCEECEVKSICDKNDDLFNFCTSEIPPYANLKKPKIRGGKSTTSE